MTGEYSVASKEGRNIWRIGLASFAAAGLFYLGGCAAIESMFSPPPPPPPPPPPARMEPIPSPSKEESPPPPIKREPAPPAPKRPPSPPPPKKEQSPPPAKREPAPPPTVKEPEAPPPRKEPEPTPPVLAPQVGKDDEEQQRREASARIVRVERLVGQLEEKKLSEGQREQLLTIRSFLDKAKDALGERDLAKASNLADKARILAEELAQGVR
jgi:hypothetical protein